MTGRSRLTRFLRGAEEAPPLERIHPYLVTAEYPDALAGPGQAQRVLGHGLSIALVTPTGPTDLAVQKPVTAAELATARTDLEGAYGIADDNLSKSLSAGEISLQFFETGPAGVPVVVVGGHWLAAATLVAPGLHGRMAPLLGDEIVAAVPRRELLFLFGAAHAAVMASIVDDEFRTADRPLTNLLFRLAADGPTPVGVR